MVVKTHGLTHVGLKVADPERSLRVYRDVFGVVEYDRDDEHPYSREGGRHRGARHIRRAMRD